MVSSNGQDDKPPTVQIQKVEKEAEKQPPAEVKKKWPFAHDERCADVTPQEPLTTIKTLADLPALLFTRKVVGEAVEVKAPNGDFSATLFKQWPNCTKFYAVSPSYPISFNSGPVVVFDKSSKEAAEQIPDKSLALVYLNNYATVLEDLAIWYPKLKLGGIMSGGFKDLKNGDNAALFEESLNTPVLQFSRAVCRQVSLTYRTGKSPSFYFAK
ncbi:hypothetical protein Pelo_16240 [Pelomyxa schiedti]|nr:hypothetical protein Pelo_16240 [Pelomyxa schiedti]